MHNPIPPRPRFLIVRRDNIGDLICTTPVFSALRAAFPDAYIAALVNSYNAPVLAGHPAIDRIFVYTKEKHRADGESLFGVYFRRLKLIHELRRRRFDYVILATPGFARRALHFARWLRPRHIIGYVEADKRPRRIDIPILHDRKLRAHEVERVYRLLEPLNVPAPPPALYVCVDSAHAQRVRAEIGTRPWAATRPRVGVHISVRKPANVWPVENFAALMRAIWQRYRLPFLLMWAPGDESNPMHPGDDGKAAGLLENLHDLPVLPMPTHRLEELAAVISNCDLLICLDGGAMHLGAAMRVPSLCLFGNDDPDRWAPWGMPKVVLKSPTQRAVNITVDEALAGFERLLREQFPDAASPRA